VIGSVHHDKIATLVLSPKKRFRDILDTQNERLKKHSKGLYFDYDILMLVITIKRSETIQLIPRWNYSYH